MDKTKTGKDQEIALPPEVLEVLKTHADALPAGPMRDSELLFPSESGGLRTRNVLAKPFLAIAKEIERETGRKVKLTPRGMRRTFNDVARLAGVHDVVTRSISGHTTEKMQHHYSTALEKEQRSELSKVHKVLAGDTQDGS
jgi:integrase